MNKKRSCLGIFVLFFGCVVFVSFMSACPSPVGDDPTPAPTDIATLSPTDEPTIEPTVVPTDEPTAVPTRCPTCGAGESVGDVWVVPATQNVVSGATLKIEIHVNTGTIILAAYGIDITYNQSVLGSPSVAAEPTGFVSASNTGNAGKVVTSGFDTNGKGPSVDLALFNITFNTIAKGSSDIGVNVNTIVDSSPHTIGIPTGFNGSVTVQ